MAASSADLERWAASVVNELGDQWLSVFILTGVEPLPATADREEGREMRLLSRNMHHILKELHTKEKPGKEKYETLGRLNTEMVDSLTTHYYRQVSEDESEEVLSYTDMITQFLHQWLVDGTEDLDEKLEQIHYALAKSLRTDLVPTFPDPEQYWEDIVWIRSREMEVNSLSEDFLLWVRTHGQRLRRKWLNVTSLEYDQVPSYTSGDVIGNILEFRPDAPDDALKFKEPVDVHIPFEETEVEEGHEVALVMLDKNRRWKDVPAVLDEGDFAVVMQCPSLASPRVFTVVYRLQVDNTVVGTGGATLQSSVEPEISLNIPPGTFEMADNEVKLQVEDTADATAGMEGMTGVSQLVHVTSDAEGSHPVLLDVPLRKQDGTHVDITSSLTIQVAVRDADDTWRTDAEVRSVKAGVATVEVKLIAASAAVLLMQTPQNTTPNQVQRLAREVDDRLHAHTAVVLFRQHHKDKRNALVKVSRAERAEDDLLVMEKKGFTEGPCMDTTTEFRVREKQRIHMFFTDAGHVGMLKDRKKLRFNPRLGSQMVNCKLVVRPAAPPGPTVDGVFRVEVERGAGEEEEEEEEGEGDIELIVTVDQEVVFETAPSKMTTQLDEMAAIRQDIEYIGLTIKDLHAVRNRWKFIGRRLELTEADLEEVDHLHRYPPEKVCQMLNMYVERTGSKASKKRVVQALVDEKLKDAAETAAYPSNVDAILHGP